MYKHRSAVIAPLAAALSFAFASCGTSQTPAADAERIGAAQIEDARLECNERGACRATIPIEIRPERIQLPGTDTVDVYAFSTESFDATAINPNSTLLVVRGGSTPGVAMLRLDGEPLTSVADVNGDGRPDLRMRFSAERLQHFGLSPDLSEMYLQGRAGRRITFVGMDPTPPEIVQ